MAKLRISNLLTIAVCLAWTHPAAMCDDSQDTEFFERRIRPILVKHCYECHSEAAREQQGGLLLDRVSGWLVGGDSGTAVVPGEPESSLLIRAISYEKEDLQMPPDGKLMGSEIALITAWIERGAPGPLEDMGETEFSRLGDQTYLFEKARQHWAFQPVRAVQPPEASDPAWNTNAIDRFVFDRLQQQGLQPSHSAAGEVLARRLHYALTGLPPTVELIADFSDDPSNAFEQATERLLESPAFAEHFARMWLDVARYADTDNFYRPDTRTPHYFPFAFTYRDYVIRSFAADKPFAQFIREQLAADLMDLGENAEQLAALGFLAAGPHANRNPTEALDDWIDLTTRGLMGLTVACARCHDHKYEPIPTADYYALRGVFASIDRLGPLDEALLPRIDYADSARAEDVDDYQQKRAAIEIKIGEAGDTKSNANNLSVAQRIRETELAELLAFHPGAPILAMTVREKKRPQPSFIYVRGEPGIQGDEVPRRFLKIIDPDQAPFSDHSSGRLDLAEKIVANDNPLTARVWVNRVWGHLMGSYLVDTPSDFGFQGSPPTHPQLLDWLAADFVEQGGSLKHLVRRIVNSRTFQQQSLFRADAAAIDPTNQLLWRANRRHLSIEQLRDSMLMVSGQLDPTPWGRPGPLWDEGYTKRRAIYGFVNRFNLDPTLRAFDFPAPLQTQPKRGESIVATQALFTLNSPFVIDQAHAIIDSVSFQDCDSDPERIQAIFRAVYQRKPDIEEVAQVTKVVASLQRMNNNLKKQVKLTEPWSLVAQSLLMSNEFQYVD